MKTNRLLSVAMIVSVIVLAGFSAASLSLGSLGAASGVALAQVAPTALPPIAVSDVTSAPGSLAAFESTFEQIYTQVNPSVVNIDVIQQATTSSGGGRFGNSPFGFGQSGPSEALGSGFVWDKQGDIVTNNHVVNGASSISVTFADGTTVDAKVVGNDPNADLAVIKVDVPADLLQPVIVADSTQVKVGEIAIAIGNPYGNAGSMSQGIISGLSRTIPADSTGNSSTTYSIPDIIQTDAAINPGNSGGVLVDDQGRLIGVTSAMESSSGSGSGVGFVIPSAIVEKVVPALIKTGHFDHPWLGLSGTTLTPDLVKAMNLKSSQKGVLVMDLAAGGPAAQAGLKASDTQATVSGQQVPVGGDVITAVNGQPVNRFEDLMSYLLNQTQPGQSVTLTILRGGKEQTLKLTLGTMPTN